MEVVCSSETRKREEKNQRYAISPLQSDGWRVRRPLGYGMCAKYGNSARSTAKKQNINNQVAIEPTVIIVEVIERAVRITMHAL